MSINKVLYLSYLHMMNNLTIASGRSLRCASELSEIIGNLPVSRKGEIVDHTFFLQHRQLAGPADSTKQTTCTLYNLMSRLPKPSFCGVR